MSTMVMLNECRVRFLAGARIPKSLARVTVDALTQTFHHSLRGDMSKTYFLEISEVLDQSGLLGIDDNTEPRYFAYAFGNLATVGYAAKEGLAEVAASKITDVSVLFTEVTGINQELEDGARVVSRLQADAETVSIVLRKKLSAERKAEKGAVLLADNEAALATAVSE